MPTIMVESSTPFTGLAPLKVAVAVTELGEETRSVANPPIWKKDVPLVVKDRVNGAAKLVVSLTKEQPAVAHDKVEAATASSFATGVVYEVLAVGFEELVRPFV